MFRLLSAQNGHQNEEGDGKVKDCSWPKRAISLRALQDAALHNKTPVTYSGLQPPAAVNPDFGQIFGFTAAARRNAM